MCEAVEPGGEVVRVRRLGGGLGGATHAIDVSTYRQMRRRLVLKRYPGGHPTIAREWRGLEVARDLEVPSPEPVALDADGTWFGTPALVMTRLPGRAEVNLVNTDAYVGQVASALARIHRAPAVPGMPEAVDPQPSHIWASPALPPRSLLLRRAHQTIEHACAAEAEQILIHGDFHPGNLLWSRGRLTGVVDWASLGRGPRAYEVAHCRADLALLFGRLTADRLLERYAADTGETPSGLALWDLYCGLIALENFRFWLVAYGEQGLVASNARQIRARLLVFVGRALAALER
ncbi:MAG: phosphotransferase [Chloroflexota bacterium]|nr:phosphotransferase [Chloroflexota bacterium]